MRVDRIFLLGMFALIVGSVPAHPQTVPLVLTGGTVVDVTNWGHSAADLTNAAVVMQDGRITDVGPQSLVQIPKGARVIDCTGKYILPGLIDGFAGMSSQGEANANL